MYWTRDGSSVALKPLWLSIQLPWKLTINFVEDSWWQRRAVSGWCVRVNSFCLWCVLNSNNPLFERTCKRLYPGPNFHRRLGLITPGRYWHTRRRYDLLARSVAFEPNFWLHNSSVAWNMPFAWRKQQAQRLNKGQELSVQRWHKNLAQMSRIFAVILRVHSWTRPEPLRQEVKYRHKVLRDSFFVWWKSAK